MNATELPYLERPVRLPRVEPIRPFHFVVIYDEQNAAAEARRLLGPFLSISLRGPEIHRDELSFAELGHPELQRETLEMTAECDLLTIATVNGESLATSVMSWLNLWLQSRRQKEAALVSLVGSSDGSLLGSAVHQHLQCVADGYGLAFFSAVFNSTAIRRGNSQLDELYRHSPRPERWGINE